MSHYFINDPHLKSNEKTYHTTLFDMNFKFIADSGVFSQKGLDYGTKTLLTYLSLDGNEQEILDVGCGIGVIGIILKKKYPQLNITMSDVNLRALELAGKNASLNNVSVNIIESDLYENINQKFDVIISNPPIRAGKKIIYKLYTDARNHLNDGGFLWIVVRKQQGAKSTVDFLKTLYQTVLVVKKDKGFHIIQAKLQ